MLDTDLEGVLDDFLPAPYPAPLFAAAVQQLDFGEVRKPTRKRLTFKVSNIGGEGNLEVTLTPNLPNQQWFRVRPMHVVIPAGEDCIVDVEIDTAQEGCALGRQELDIQVEAPSSMVQEIPRIRVTAEILPEIRLMAEPPIADFGEVALGESQTLTVTISRSDEREISLNERLMEVVDDLGTHRPAWANLKLGPAGRQQTVSITFHTANRAIRDYQCRLHLADAKPEVNPVDVPLHIRVAPPPELQLKWAIAPLPTFSGDTQESQLAIGNTGGGILRGRVTGDQFWLRVPGGALEVRSGDAQMVAVRIGDARLGAGVYNGLLEIASNDGGRSRVARIPVELEVEAEDASPVEVAWEGSLGQLARGQRSERFLTVRNRMARPFEGTLTCTDPSWLRPKDGGGKVRLAPGEMQQIPLEVNTRPLVAGKTDTQHATTLRLVDAAGKECWAGAAELTLLPARGPWLLKAAMGLLGLLLLVLLAMYVVRAREHLPSLVRSSTVRRSPGDTRPRRETDPDRADLLYQQGRTEYERKEWQAAGVLFQRAAGLDPNPARCYVALGQCRYQLGKYATAAQALKTALKLKPHSAEAHVWLGKAYRRLGQTAKARRELKEALRHDPRNRQAKAELAKLR